MQKKFAKDLIIGEAFEGVPFQLFSIVGSTDRDIKVLFSDRSGTVAGSISKTVLEDMLLSEHVGKVFSLTASVLVEKKEPLVVVRELSLTDNYLPAEIYSGLDEAKKAEFVELIRSAMARFTHKGYLSLVEHCLTDETLAKMGTIPATHGYYGCYVGGALAATVAVTYMMMSSMASYVNKGNGITTKAPNWNVLLAGTLLFCYGRIDYCEENDPFKKSARGVAMNYFSTLQHAIETVIYRHNIDLTEQEIANLLNVLAVAVSTKTDTKAVSKDGVILRHIVRLYGECDAVDFQMANHSAEEGEEYFYSRKLSRYLLTSTEREGE